GHAPLLFRQERHVQRRYFRLPRDLQTPRRELLLGVGLFWFRARQQPPATCGRERNADLQLWIIFATGAMPRIGPCVIEDVFTARMTLQVHRHDADDVADAVLENQMKRLPTGFGQCAAAGFERTQESVFEERIVRDWCAGTL